MDENFEQRLIKDLMYPRHSISGSKLRHISYFEKVRNNNSYFDQLYPRLHKEKAKNYYLGKSKRFCYHVCLKKSIVSLTVFSRSQNDHNPDLADMHNFSNLPSGDSHRVSVWKKRDRVEISWVTDPSNHRFRAQLFIEAALLVDCLESRLNNFSP